MEENTAYGITEREKEIARRCLGHALRCGASQVRVSLNKSVMDSFMMLNGELDKVAHCADRSVFIYIFADGKYGTYSTNRLEFPELEDFVGKAVEKTKMLAPDEFRKLPDPSRKEKGAVTGREAGLYDPCYGTMDAACKRELAMSGSIFGKTEKSGGYELVSEECEYSDSIDDNFLTDSDGFEGRHTETSFAFWSEITVSGPDGRKYSGYQWTSAPKFSEISIGGCSRSALETAVSKIGPRRSRGGKMTMVVDNMSSSRLIAPLFSALSGSAIQQHNSFLEGTLGKRVFPECLSIIDMARTAGKPGARLFDTEGVATLERPVIGRGVVSMYFTNTYISGKTGMEPTVEGVSRPVVRPFLGKDDDGGRDAGDNLNCKENEINLHTILEFCSDGILVTGFNGGSCNPTTGNFSYGIEGFAFRKGRITHPVKEMVITGNMVSLWNSLTAAGSDAHPGARWQIPTLAFSDTCFSA